MVTTNKASRRSTPFECVEDMPLWVLGMEFMEFLVERPLIDAELHSGVSVIFSSGDIGVGPVFGGSGKPDDVS